jgi:hypothetical protein
MAHAVNGLNRFDSDANRKKRAELQEELDAAVAAATVPGYHGKIRLEVDVVDGTLMTTTTTKEKKRK